MTQDEGRPGPGECETPQSPLPSAAEMEELNDFYRAGGLRRMASPQVHYREPNCPHPGCNQKMEWIDFRLELYHYPEWIYKPLIRAWWGRTGFVGMCPRCGNWIRFTTLRMEAIDDATARELPNLPDNWYAVAQFA